MADKIESPPFTDQQKADAYRAEIMPHLNAACAVIDRAKKDGLIFGFNLSDDQYGRRTVQGLTVVKPL